MRRFALVGALVLVGCGGDAFDGAEAFSGSPPPDDAPSDQMVVVDAGLASPDAPVVVDGGARDAVAAEGGDAGVDVVDAGDAGDAGDAQVDVVDAGDAAPDAPLTREERCKTGCRTDETTYGTCGFKGTVYTCETWTLGCDNLCDNMCKAMGSTSYCSIHGHCSCSFN